MIDLYCERLGPEFWAEPINALTNLSFIVAGVALWKLAKQRRLLGTETWVVIVLMVSIGIGSFLFHTFATPWARILDVLPILAFQMTFLWLYGRHVINLKAGYLVGLLILFIILALLTRQHQNILNGSLIYAPSLLFLTILGIYHYLHAKNGKVLLVLATIIYLVSLTFRTIDLITCEHTPFGTHFMWHLLNGLMVYLVGRSLLVNLDPITKKGS
jgi:hypothetical protein